jgi:hypothetical protein
LSGFAGSRGNAQEVLTTWALDLAAGIRFSTLQMLATERAGEFKLIHNQSIAATASWCWPGVLSLTNLKRAGNQISCDLKNAWASGCWLESLIRLQFVAAAASESLLPFEYGLFHRIVGNDDDQKCHGRAY